MIADDDITPPGFIPIRTVSSITGVNSVTLRAWERRYQLITPQRTPKGHRLYSQKDVERIKQILGLLDQGISIGQVKPLLDQSKTIIDSTFDKKEVNEWEKFLQRMLEAVYQFNADALDEIYNDALSLYPLSMVINQLITPLLKHLGADWNSRPAGIAEEHFFSAYLHNKIGSRFQHLAHQANGPSLLISCLPDEYHDIGMLLFSLAVSSHGYAVTPFGANLPLEQIPLIVSRKKFDGVVLSATNRICRKTLNEGIPALVSRLDIPVFVGGSACLKQNSAIKDAGAISAGDNLVKAIQLIDQRLRSGAQH